MEVLFQGKKPEEATSSGDTFKLMSQFNPVTGALPVVEINENGCCAARLEDAVGGNARYDLAANVPVTTEQCVKIKFKRSGVENQIVLFRINGDAGVASDLRVDTETGEITTSLVGAGLRPEILYSEVTDDTICIVAKFLPVASNAFWSIFPAVSGTGQIGTGTLDIIEFDTNYMCDQPELICPLADYDNIVAYQPLDRTSLPLEIGRFAPQENVTFSPATGASQTECVSFIGADGVYVPATVTVQRINAGGGALTINSLNGSIQNSPGGSDYIITIELNCDVEVAWNVYAQSVGPGEALAFFAANPVTSYDQGAGGPNLTLPYVGGWNNNNNNNPSGFGFDASRTFTMRTNGQASVSSNMTISIAEGPAATPVAACDAIAKLRCDVEELSGNTETVTNIAQDLTADTITYTNEAGTAQVMDLAKYNRVVINYEWEEGGALASNSAQWSVGNGAVGNTSLVNPVDVELKYATFHAETAGTSVSINVIVIGTGTIATPNFVGQSGVVEFNPPIAIPAGSNIVLTTGTEVGAYTDARVSLYMTADNF